MYSGKTNYSLLLAALPTVGLSLITAALADDTAATATDPRAVGPLAGSAARPGAVGAPKEKPDENGQGILFPYGLLAMALQGKLDDSGNVDYLELKNDPNLQAFLRAVAKADLTQFPVFSDRVKDETTQKTRTIVDHSAELVFWINAYNAFMLKSLSDAFPIAGADAVKDLDTAKTHIVAGKSYSLREIREKITRSDPRAIFALTDGTKNGPVLFAGDPTYHFADVNDRLNQVIKIFVNNPRNVEVNRIKNTVTVNDFLKQTDSLFKSEGGREKWDGIRKVLAGYLKSGPTRNFVTTMDYQIDFQINDHSLNNTSNKSAAGTLTY